MAEGKPEFLNAIWVAAQRHAGPHDYRQTDQAWQDLIVWASPKGLLGRSMEMRGIGLLWDDPARHPAERRRYDVGIPIDPDDEELVDEPSFVHVTAPGRYIRVRHTGPYDTILDTYDKAQVEHFRYGDWVIPAQPIIEIYRDSPAETDEDDLRTDIYFPVIKR